MNTNKTKHTQKILYTTNIMSKEVITESLLDDLDDLSDAVEGEDDDDNDDSNKNSNNNYDHHHYHNDNDNLNTTNHQQQQQDGDNDNYKNQHYSTTLTNNVVDQSSSTTTGSKSSQQRIEVDTNDILSPRLLSDRIFINHLQSIRTLTVKNDNEDNESSLTSQKELAVPVQDDVEHKLIVQSNKHLINLNTELVRVYNILCILYKPKFTELEELIPNPIQYMRTVRVIGNEMDMTRITDKLHNIISNNQIITISVAGSTTYGRQLSINELNNVYTVINYMEQIDSIQNEIITFIESYMEYIAPNVCALIGSKITAELISITGSIYELANIPSCNIHLLGQTKHNSNSRAGLSSTSTSLSTSTTNNSNQGVIIQCDLIQSCPKVYQNKMIKLVTAKVALAARCDVTTTTTSNFTSATTSTTRTAEHGIKFRQEILSKFNKLQQPDTKAQTIKALPKPDLTVKKRRGGKHMRRIKERYEETALMKQVNTRAFSTQVGEYGDDAMGRTLGLLETTNNTNGTGAIRKNVGERKKMKYANTRESRKRSAIQQQQQQQYNNSNNNNPLHDSKMIFNPNQGMELINPDSIKNKNNKAGDGNNQKWFSDTARFNSSNT